MIIMHQPSSHWYKDNQPFYEVPCKSKPGTMRKTTIKDAREFGAVPSVTGIENVINKPALTNWKIEQGILSALTLPRLPDEGDDAFARRIVDDMEAGSRGAMDLGTAIHDAVESAVLGQEYDEKLKVYVDPTLVAFKALKINIASTEQSFSTPLYGGRVDLHGTIQNGMEFVPVVLDWKSQATTKSKIKTYPEWGEQLAAYANGLGLPLDKVMLYSVVISTTEPGFVAVHQWDNAKERYEMFLNIFKLWCSRNNWVAPICE